MRRSGRPYRPPEDRSDRRSALPDLQLRAAWLLGTNRVHARDGAYVQRRTLLARLQEAGVPCDESRLSRWESGAAAQPVSVVAAYEQVLGLPTYSLRGALDLGRPVSESPFGLFSPPGVDEHIRLDQILDQVLHGHVTGPEWLELAQLVAQSPQIYLRGEDWAHLAQRLLDELSRSRRTSFTTRHSALATLISVPTAQRHIVRSIGTTIVEDASVDVGPAVRLLGHVDDTRGSTLILRLLESPDEDVRRNAAHALAGMLADSTFDDNQFAALEQHLVASIRPDALGPQADVVLRLPDELRQRLESRLQHPLLGQLGHDHELVLRPVARQVARKVAAHASRHTTNPPDEPDSMLARLCREALFHVHFRRRQAARATLAASPFSDGVASACAALLGHELPVVARQAARVLAWTATARHGAELLRYAAEGADPLLSRNCLLAFAHVPAPPDRNARSVLTAAGRSPHAMVRGAAAFALRMHGLDPAGPGGRDADQGCRITD